MIGLVLFGPPAVGKMTVGLELQRMTGLRLFHNHMTIDLVLPFFPFGSPPFQRLVGEFRRRMFEEVAASDLPGLIFTFVWALDEPEDKAFVDELQRIFWAQGAPTYFVELTAPLEERLVRNESELRLRMKAPKRDLERSRSGLLANEKEYRMNSSGDFYYPERHLKIDNTRLTPEATARRIVERFSLPTLS